MSTLLEMPQSIFAPYKDRHREIQFQAKKQAVHHRIVESLDVSSAEEMDRDQLIEELRYFIEMFDDEIEWTEEEHERLLFELPWEMFGTGPLEYLLDDSEISDILVNQAHEVFIERHGTLRPSDVLFADDAHLMRIIRRIVTQVGRRIDESSPMVDARLEDGSRINAIIPPLALDGPKLSIRRFGNRHANLASLVANGTMNESIAEFLRAAVTARQSILISGGTGSGKTTMLNALSSCIPDDQRIITIEDSAELRLQHRHVARLETRPAGSENVAEYSQRDLVRNSLRMRPDRIIVGEVRGPEALDMLQAMNTGHEGSLTTIHANDTVDAVSRLELMIAMAGLDLPLTVLRSYICSGISLIVHVVRMQGGGRRVMRISELNATESGFELIDVFSLRRTGIDDNGNATGEFVIGRRPHCVESFAEHGVCYDDSLFNETLVG
ncbi:CpaF family protein [Rhodopirellula sp. MGV]|uniref:CpaF family protein n=1 Tax=Rhodopirellula sp. MGV TaxID=2023130 RepID=UPI000B97924F|nr:CpaF family protein [Rhodopirellula sp. MGV]OYP37702.1 pilus assembly protein CpaF [Rhodopirellula sp. MGV]PNY37140.1 CpaF family protein [Rhodopirellula baltica]